MNQEKEILKEIRSIESSTSKLYSYLYDLIYEGRVKNLKFLESVYSSFLQDERASIKQISIYALLFGMQIKNEEYKQKAIEYVRDLGSTDDLRMFSLSGLSQAYMNIRDVELLSLFYDLYMNEGEESDIRATSFVGMMRFLGLSTVDVTQINGSVIIGYDDINLNEFGVQLGEIKRILREQ